MCPWATQHNVYSCYLMSCLVNVPLSSVRSRRLRCARLCLSDGSICWLWANVDPSPDPCSYQCARQTLKFTRPTMNVTVQVWCGVEKADWKCFILSILYRKVHEMQRSYRFFPRRRSCVDVNMLRWAVSVAVNKEQRKLYVSKTSDVLILFFLSD